ncbi:hypothetical protein N665_0234s0030 [Sinapis alba]|nr:hypothetical protein N665_0234s0030 [Sinapis alba]
MNNITSNINYYILCQAQTPSMEAHDVMEGGQIMGVDMLLDNKIWKADERGSSRNNYREITSHGRGEKIHRT